MLVLNKLDSAARSSNDLTAISPDVSTTLIFTSCAVNPLGGVPVTVNVFGSRESQFGPSIVADVI